MTIPRAHHRLKHRGIVTRRKPRRAKRGALRLWTAASVGFYGAAVVATAKHSAALVAHLIRSTQTEGRPIMLTNSLDNSILSKPQKDAPVTIDQALQVMEMVAAYCKELGFTWRTINDTQDGVPILVVLIPRVIETRDARGIQRFLVAQDTTKAGEP